MTTLLLLLAHYDGKAVLPFAVVAHDVFGLEPAALLRRLKSGAIDAHGEDPDVLKHQGIPLVWLAEVIEDRRRMAHDKMREWSRSR